MRTTLWQVAADGARGDAQFTVDSVALMAICVVTRDISSPSVVKIFFQSLRGSERFTSQMPFGNVLELAEISL